MQGVFLFALRRPSNKLVTKQYFLIVCCVSVTTTTIPPPTPPKNDFDLLSKSRLSHLYLEMLRSQIIESATSVMCNNATSKKMFTIVINGLRVLLVFVFVKFLALDLLHFCVISGRPVVTHNRGLLFCVGNNLMTSLNDSTWPKPAYKRYLLLGPFAGFRFDVREKLRQCHFEAWPFAQNSRTYTSRSLQVYYKTCVIGALCFTAVLCVVTQRSSHWLGDTRETHFALLP